MNAPDPDENEHVWISGTVPRRRRTVHVAGMRINDIPSNLRDTYIALGENNTIAEAVEALDAALDLTVGMPSRAAAIQTNLDAIRARVLDDLQSELPKSVFSKNSAAIADAITSVILLATEASRDLETS